MRPPRLRLRTLMSLVLLAGVGAWGFKAWWPRYRECRSRADHYAAAETFQRQCAAKLRKLRPAARARIAEARRIHEELAAAGAGARDLAACESLVASAGDHASVISADIARIDKRVEWYKARADEWRHAAHSPWLAVPPSEVMPE